MGLALLVVLDTLAPAERVAFVLHDVFDVPFAEISAMLGRSADATRQLASRARRRVRAAGATEPDSAVAAQRAVVDAFFAAARAGDLTALVGLLDPDVVLRTDGFAGMPAVLRGATTVASAVASSASPRAEFRPVLVNGAAGVLITLQGRPAALMAFTIINGRITAVNGITDPHRVTKVGRLSILTAGLLPLAMAAGSRHSAILRRPVQHPADPRTTVLSHHEEPHAPDAAGHCPHSPLPATGENPSARANIRRSVRWASPRPLCPEPLRNGGYGGSAYPLLADRGMVSGLAP